MMTFPSEWSNKIPVPNHQPARIWNNNMVALPRETWGDADHKLKFGWENLNCPYRWLSKVYSEMNASKTNSTTTGFMQGWFGGKPLHKTVANLGYHATRSV
jgi:hypothetical protein